LHKIAVDTNEFCINNARNASINQFIVNALAKKISSLKTLDYLEQKVNNTSVDNMLNLLNKVQDTKPQKYDKL